MSGYDVYLGDMLLPIAPKSIDTQINGKNKVYSLINEGELNILKLAGLSTVSFSILLPAVKYPFATYQNGFQKPSYYLNRLEKLKQEKKGFQFIVSRYNNNTVRKNLHNTNMTVSLEDYRIIENAKENGFDIKVEINLKQYKEVKTKTFSVVTPSPTAPVAVTPVRPQTTVTKPDGKGGGGGGNGGGSGMKKYKVQIPGMGVLEVTASSIQDAITKAGAGSWTGTIYVDGVTYYVNKGKLAVDPNKTTAAIGAVIGNTLSEIAKKAIETAKTTVVTAAKITGTIAKGVTETLKDKTTSAINNILNRNVLNTTSTTSTVKKPATTSGGTATTTTRTALNNKAVMTKN